MVIFYCLFFNAIIYALTTETINRSIPIIVYTLQKIPKFNEYVYCLSKENENNKDTIKEIIYSTTNFIKIATFQFFVTICMILI